MGIILRSPSPPYTIQIRQFFQVNSPQLVYSYPQHFLAHFEASSDIAHSIVVADESNAPTNHIKYNSFDVGPIYDTITVFFLGIHGFALVIAILCL